MNRADTLKVAAADIREAADFVFKAVEALEGKGFYHLDVKVPAKRAIGVLEGTAKRLRRSFALDNG